MSQFFRQLTIITTDNFQASRVLTFQTVEGLVLLVAAIPVIKHVTQTRLRFPVSKVDGYITGIGFMCMSAGCLIMGFSQAWNSFIFGIYHAHLSTRSAFANIQFKALWS